MKEKPKLVTLGELVQREEQTKQMMDVEKPEKKRTLREVLKNQRTENELNPHKEVLGDLFALTTMTLALFLAFYERIYFLMAIGIIVIFVFIYALLQDAYFPLREYNKRFGPATWRVEKKKPHRIDHFYSVTNPNDPGPYSGNSIPEKKEK